MLIGIIGSGIEERQLTAYKNFVQDFPNRCMDLLNLAEKQARAQDREVTLVLLVASAGFVIPFERLRPPGKLDHPIGDRERYPEYSEKLKQLMDSKFRGSELHPEQDTLWKAGNLKCIQGDPDSWPELNKNKTLSSEKTTSNVLKGIRNALAHGNIFTTGNPISSIIFVSVNTNDEGDQITGYSFIKTSPEAFLSFLKAWFTFVKQQKLSQYDVSKVLKDAA